MPSELPWASSDWAVAAADAPCEAPEDSTNCTTWKCVAPPVGGLGIRTDESQPLISSAAKDAQRRRVTFADDAVEQPSELTSGWRRPRQILIGTLHIGCSSSVVLLNKYVLDADRFPYATLLTTFQMAFAFVLCSALLQLSPQLFPSARVLLATRRNTRQDGSAGAFILIGMSSGACIVTSNFALRLASVSFCQLLKETVTPWVYLLALFLGLEVWRFKNFLVLAFVCGMVVLSASGAPVMRPAVLFQLSSSMAQAVQAVLTSRLMKRSSGPKADPLSIVLGSSPVVLMLLLPASYYVWDANTLPRIATAGPLLVANGLSAFALQVVNAITIWELPASGLACVAVLKDVAIVVSASFVFHDHLSPQQMICFAGALVGIAVHSAMKLHPDWFERRNEQGEP